MTTRVAHVQSVQMPAKLSAELMARAGHDIVSLEMHYPWLFQPGLADMSDLCTDLARKHGEWFPFLKEHASVRGQWLGVPYLFSSFPGSHRIDNHPVWRDMESHPVWDVDPKYKPLKSLVAYDALDFRLGPEDRVPGLGRVRHDPREHVRDDIGIRDELGSLVRRRRPAVQVGVSTRNKRPR